MVESHKGIATDVHQEVHHDSRREDQEHLGYEWETCVICGAEFIRGKGAERAHTMAIVGCGDPNCGKVAA